MTSRKPENRAKPEFAQLRRLAVPAAIAVVAVLAAAAGEPARLWLRYQRDLLAEGEIWRLITGHLVHLGPSHMAMNVLALAILTLVIRQLFKPIDWLWVGLFSALAIDAGLFWRSTEVVWYVGLSGVLHGCWAGAAVRAWEHKRRDAAALSALIIIKLAYEAWLGPVPITDAVAAGPVVAVAHAYGAVGGALWAGASFAIRRLKRPL